MFSVKCFPSSIFRQLFAVKCFPSSAFVFAHVCARLPTDQVLTNKHSLHGSVQLLLQELLSIRHVQHMHIEQGGTHWFPEAYLALQAFGGRRGLACRMRLVCIAHRLPEYTMYDINFCPATILRELLVEKLYQT